MLKKYQPYSIYLYLILFFIVNLMFLTTFPFVHSDEPWLSGLTVNMLETKSIFSTETFFNLYPRYPHSIKLLFHLIQMPFILLLGNNVFSVRLISLLFSVLSLLYFYKIVKQISRKESFALFNTILFSLNIQYLYASHFARQEIILLFFLLIGFHYYLNMSSSSIQSHMLMGCILGLSVGIHPNSFIIALVFGLLYLYDILLGKKKIIHLVTLVGTTGFFAFIFVILSLIGDPDFITHYTTYGSNFGVTLTLMDKLLTIDDFYLKLYYGISGTYYTPNIKLYFTAFAMIFTYYLVYSLVNIKNSGKLQQYDLAVKSLLAILAINAGIVIIGRYNATSILFVFPFFYLLISTLLFKLYTSYKNIFIIFFVLFLSMTSYNSYTGVSAYTQNSYEDYLYEISKVIQPEDKTLGNLNAEFYFDNGALLDYRNLAFLEQCKLSFADYIRKNNIEYIMYYEELDYIHRNPKWSILYGEDDYYDAMNTFIEENCTLEYEFTDSLYGIRIPRYMFDYDWHIKIYKVDAY